MVAQIPWSIYFVKTVMNPGGRGRVLEDMAAKMVGQRLKAGSMTKDLFHHLVSPVDLVLASYIILKPIS